MTLDELYKKLELTDDCLIRLSEPEWKNKVSFPSRIYRLLETNDLLKQLDAFFCFDNKPLILFFKDPQDKQALHKAIWNFNESPIAIIVSDEVVEIFNGFSINKETGCLCEIAKEDKLDDFSYFELVTGKTWEKYKTDISHRNRVDYKLLENIDAVQKKLIDLGLNQKVANALIGKIIFIRYLIDRKVQLHFQDIPKLWTNEDLCELLLRKEQYIQFVKYLEDSEKGFNGDLFRITSDDYETISQEALNIIILLLQGVEIKTGQLSLFKLYDFSILPVEFISNVYEKFIGKENQNEEGAYYTPTFLVDYIIQQTIGKHFDSTHSYDCKVLDPACGSGIFLVESLRRIIDKYIKENNVRDEDRNSDGFRKKLKNLVRHNIYGIDKDESAVQVAIFSIYLTLLDYQSPADIGNFKFPNLLGTNLICSDTFDTSNASLNRLLEQHIQFDYIIGNPPWMRGRIQKDHMGKSIVPQYMRYLRSTQQLNFVGNKEIAQAFALRSLDFASNKTQIALILTSKVLYNLQTKKFRQHILQNCYVDQVFELAAVRREVFNKSNDKATTPACVLFYRKATEVVPEDHLIEHIALKPSRFFSMFKVFTLTRNDVQYVRQNLLLEDDCLWKVLVYGSYLDYNFIKKLKSHKSIQAHLTEIGATCHQGLKRKDGNKSINTTDLIGWDFLDLSKEIKQFYIFPEHQKWTRPSVGYIYRTPQNTIDFSIYTPPMLLTKETVNTDLESISSISSQKLLFTDKITSIKINGNNAIQEYRNIAGLINSSLFAYYILHSSSTVGIMIEQQVNDQERFSFPYLVSNEIAAIIQEIESIYLSTQHNVLRQNIDIADYKARINAKLCELLKLNTIERDLLDYATTIMIPIVMKHRTVALLNRPIDLDDKEHILQNYASVFVNRFAQSFSRENQVFRVKIYHTPLYIGMIFSIEPIESLDDKSNVLIIDASKQKGFWEKCIALSSEQITYNLFIQKDLRGFENDCFYVVKPNEKRLWHKAIAHLDVNEFANAMLKEGGAL
ncbi:MAG: N-6 DNA methylase [Paludibacteraceae bacterium]|nr:N-6 DNA methylase [Paludibacteraceae bacterium]